MIVSVACRLIAPVDLGAVKAGDELILSMPRPCRHHHILHMVHALGYDTIIEPKNQGFLTDIGEFVDRRTAFKIATEANQVLPRKPGGYNGDELFSEDLW